ncbi:MAG: HAD hydrolase family protein [Planctomycetota bacterium]
MDTTSEFRERAKDVRVLLCDVDGTLTDGALYLDDDNVETRRFCVRDGQGITAWRRLERPVAIITARPGKAVLERARMLGVDAVLERVEDKHAAVRSVLGRLGYASEQAAFVGDDLADLRAFRAVGCPIAVADADPHVRARAALVTEARGGHGAVREAIWRILEVQGLLEHVIEMYS